MKKRTQRLPDSPVVTAPPPPPPAAASSKGWVWMVSLVLIAAGFIAYLPALRGPFLFDDLALPYGRPDAGRAPWGGFLGGVRPLLYSLFWVESHVWGTQTFGFHILNLLLHMANSAFTGWIFYRILGWAGEAGRKRALLSVFAAGLFLLHPLQTEGVAYVASRSENLSVFFFLAAFTVFLNAVPNAISWIRALCILLLWGFALATKEHVFVLPALLLLTDYCWNPPQSLQGIKRNWRLYGIFPVLAVAGVLIIGRALKDTATVGFNMPGLTWWQYFFTQCEVFWVYLRLYVLPFGQNLDHAFPVVQTAFDPLAWAGLIAILLCAAAAFRYRREYPLAAYGFFAFLILMAPTSSFIPIRDTLVERRLYLAFPGLIAVTLELVRRWSPSLGALQAAAAIVLGLCAILTFERSRVYSSTIAAWEDSVAGNPANERSHFQLGYAYFVAGRCAEAITQYEKSAQLKPPDFTLLLDWALAADCANRPDVAVEKIKAAIAKEATAHSYAVLGMIQAKANRFEESLQALQEAEKRDPRFLMTYIYRGTILYNQRRPVEAALEFRKALTLDPNNEEARRKLAMAQAAAAR